MLNQIKPGPKVALQFDWLSKYLAGEKVYPINIEIDPSNKCSLACKHCVWGNMLSQQNELMPKDVLISLIDQCADIGVKSIVFTGGGEPLSNAATVNAIELAVSHDIDCGLFTNGVHLDVQKSEILVKSLVWIRFNLGAATAQDYAKYYNVSKRVFFTVCENIKQFCLINKGKSVGIGTAVNRSNFEMVKQLPFLAIELGVDYLQIKPDFFQMNKSDFLQWWSNTVVQYFDFIQSQVGTALNISVVPIDANYSNSLYCHAHNLTTSVTADGNVSFCKMKRDDAGSVIGNINHIPLKEVFDSLQNKLISAQICPKQCSIDGFCPYVSINDYVASLLQTAKEVPYNHRNFL